MDIIEKLQRDIDEIAEWGYCNFAETFKTLIEAKKEIAHLRDKGNEVVYKTEEVCFHTGTAGMARHSEFIKSIDEKGIRIIHAYTTFNKFNQNSPEHLCYIITYETDGK